MLERITWIDFAKGFVMILVVLGHALDDDFSLCILIYIFHMPFFFILAGYLLNLNKWGGSNNFKKFALKLFKRLLVPYYLANILFFPIWFIVCHKLGYLNYFWEWCTYKPLDSLAEIFIGDGTNLILGTLWFLPTLFLAQIILIFLYNFLIKIGAKIFLFAIAIVSCIGFVLKDFAFLPMGLDIAFAMQIFLLAGILIRRHKVLDKMDFKLYGALILILLGVFYFNETIDVNTRIYGNPLLFYAGGIAGTLLVMKFSILMTGGKIFSLISDCGRQSMMILVLHSIILNVAYEIIVDALNFPAEKIFTDYAVIFCVTATGVLIPLWIAKRFGKLPVLKYFCS
ncbi:MAG: acyltransferase family protein [Selenomonadaceae bacterium]|nr:acyltransferase family protein [Selenomonadaceae bacterium]